jgi:branched-chain amino acid transport system substrate-binding protein
MWLPSRRYTNLITRLVGVLIIGALLVGVSLSSRSGLAKRGATGGRICLATEFPTTLGKDPSLAGSWGRSLEHAVQLAVDQNQSLGSGYTLEAIHYDEIPANIASTDPQQGAQNMASMVQTPCIMGMIGPAWSAGAVAEMPTAAIAGLVMISPANTNPALTLRLYAGAYGVDFDQLHPAGKQVNYFRTIANDAFQGLEIADFASSSPPTGLGAKSAFVVDDHTAYGEVIDGGFTQEFLATGGRIVGTDGIPFGDSAAVAELAARIVASQADVVCFGGTTDTGGSALKAALDRVGYTGLFVSGDGIAEDAAFIDQAGATATRDVFAVDPVPDLSKMTSSMAVKFASAFHARYPHDDLDGYGANAYDDAMLLITAIKQVIRAGQAVTRQSVLMRVQNIRYTGVTGLISFDDNGDSTHGMFNVYGVEYGQWVWMKQLSV